MRKHLFLLIAPFVLSACASYSSILINYKGDTKEVSATGTGIIGGAAAQNSVDTRVAAYESIGYVEIERVGGIGVYLKDANGAEVVNVVPDSPADKKGLKAGCLIKAINGTPVNSADEAGGLLFGKTRTFANVTFIDTDKTEKTIEIIRVPLSELKGAK